jgi:hypothetical protein
LGFGLQFASSGDQARSAWPGVGYEASIVRPRTFDLEPRGDDLIAALILLVMALLAGSASAAV